MIFLFTKCKEFYIYYFIKRVIVERRVSSLIVTLSKNPLDENDPGYQAPLTDEERSQLVTHGIFIFFLL